jgi:Ring finger domain
VNLRRHQSLPGPLRSIGPRQQCSRGRTASTSIDANAARLRHLQNFKLNPHVGWFRHAPPLPTVGNKHVLSSKLDDVFSSACATVTLKKRRYVATASTTASASAGYQHLQHHEPEHWKVVQQSLKRALEDIKSSRNGLTMEYMATHCSKKRGYLRGGGRSDEKDLDAFLQEQYAGNESITLKALTRLACWFFDIPMENSNKCLDDSDHQEGASIVSDDEDDDDADNDNFDTIDGSGVRRRASDKEDDDTSTHTTDGRQGKSSSAAATTYLSTQAEAYYALSAVYDSMFEERDASPQRGRRRRRGSEPMDESRLDYDITQMDIVRMNRIASRHLDVESIVRLPVRTYSEPPQPGEQQREMADPPEEQRESCDDSFTVSSDDGDKHDTEFSWMLVPPPETAQSLDDGSLVDHESVDSCGPAALVNPSPGSDLRHYRSSTRDNTAALSTLAPKDDVCVICLERFVPGDRMRVLPCTHSFHVGCIDRWLSGSHSFDECYTAGCPTCKKRPDLHHHQQQQPSQQRGSPQQALDGSVPSWAFARIGDILAKDCRHF